MHLLLTSNDFPVLRRALMLSAHGDQMVRTQARTAYLTILRGLLDAEVREKAIQLAQEMLPQLLEKFLWSQWASMAEAANRQNAPAFKAAALEEEDTFEHFTELILLGIPEITELVASTVAGAFLARFGCLLSPTLDNNLWNVQFTDSYDAAIPYANSFMIVPSPKSGEVSVSESTMESDGHVDASGTSACTGEYPHDPQCGICEDVKTLELCPFNAALAWRTLASFTNIFRDANLGGVVLPLVELVTLPFVPTSLLTSIWQLKSGQPTKELAKFSEELAACAMEDVALSAWPGDVSKLKHEHWRCQLRCAPGLVRRDGEANPFRELLMSTLGTPGCGLSATSFISSPQCNMSSLHSVSTNTTAGMLMAQLQALYPRLLEDVQMIARPAMEAKEEEPNNNSGTLGSLAENISWLLTATGFRNAECSLISDPGAISKMGE